MARLQTVLAVGTLVAGGAAAGWCLSAGEAVERAETAPPGWTRSARPAPYMNPATLGSLGVDPRAWMVGRFAALGGPTGAETVEVRATLGRDGQLVVLPRGGPAADPAGPGVVFEAGKPARGVRLGAGAAPVPLVCATRPTPVGTQVRATVSFKEGALVVDSPEGMLRCDTAPGDGVAVLQAGLRRVHVQTVSLDGVTVPAPVRSASTAATILVGAVAAPLVALVQALGLAALVGPRSTVGGRAGRLLRSLGLLALPLLACLGLAAWDTGPLREVFRMPHLSLRGIPFWVGVAPTLLLWSLHGSFVLARCAGTRSWVVAALLASAAGVCVRGPLGIGLALGLVLVPPLAAWVLRRERSVALEGAAGAVALTAAAAALAGRGADSEIARLYLALAGACTGGLAWALSKALQIRAYNALSLVLALLALGSLETATRFTAVGPFWRGSGGVEAAGSTASLVREFEALEARQHTDWPEAGFPVQAPPKASPLRVVALGGSSTAGAYQNRRLDEFYPARMAELLGPSVEVVNQGVGGWNTLHLARFAQTQLETLEPDVVTVYTGVNEMVEVPVSYRDLHAAWRAGDLQPGPALLDELRLFHGFRLVVRALRGSTVAVPPEHTTEHLQDLVDAAVRAGAQVLLLSEAVQPRPEALDPWWEAMRSVAADHDHVSFFHTAPLLQPLGGAAFLDTNHLSDTGHRELARQVVGELRRLGWVNEAGAATPGDKERRTHAEP